MLILPPAFYGRLSIMGEDNSSIMRLTYWNFGWELMKQHPLFGIGYFNWLPTYSAHLLAIGDRRNPEVCHNIFIQAGSELGFPGLLLVVAIIVSTFVLNFRTRRLLRESKNPGFLRQIAFGLDAAMIGYVVSAQFVTVLYYPYLWIQLAITVALHNVVCRATQRAKS
jgi:O-antigen ligase